jgi:AraC-like DNA-binding protein/mannose-6-phosphate isomerase-like protein (cupin superfamily)
MQVLDINIDKNGQETTVHGNYAFPLAFYTSYMNRNVLGFTNWHWHNELQFCRVIKGSIRFFVNDQKFLCAEGEGIFINISQMHMAKPEGGEDSAYQCLDVHPRLLSSFTGSVFEQKYVEPYLYDRSLMAVYLKPSVTWQKKILDGIAELSKLQEKADFGYEYSMTHVIEKMWLLTVQYAPRTEPRHLHKNETVQNIMAYINSHYSEKMTIGMIAENVRFSAGECCRIFKQATGQTIFTYLKAYRILCAAELLRNTGHSITEIAYDTGFCSTSYMIEVFKEVMNTTPLQYRLKKPESL